MIDVLTFGPARYFRPVCFRYPEGFRGGPAGYEETDNPDGGPIIVPTRTNEQREQSDD